jgi:hypothetical protein
LLTLSGRISATGNGTRATLVTFSGGSRNFTAVVTNGTYKVTLANGVLYSVRVYWNGSHPWQSGRVQAGEYDANQSSSSATTKDLEVATPASDVEVTGTVSTTGMATDATRLVLTSNRTSSFSVAVTDGHYGVVLPNEVAYAVSVFWSGEYSWQKGNATSQLLLSVPSGSTEQENFAGIPTPDSNVTFTGSVSTTGDGTYPVEVLFTSSSTGNVYASLSNGQYRASLPNGVNYSLEVAWHGAFSWQSGSDLWQGGKLITVNEPAGQSTPTIEDFVLPTPNSNAVVTGFVTATGAGTYPSFIRYSGRAGNYSSQLSSSVNNYTMTLPNFDTYNVTAGWASTKYFWQVGTLQFTHVVVDVGVGAQTDVANYTLDTPEATVGVFGFITTVGVGTYPTYIKFTNAPYGQTFTISSFLTNNEYIVNLPNDATWTVTIGWKNFLGSTGTCQEGSFTLNEPPGGRFKEYDYRC